VGDGACPVCSVLAEFQSRKAHRVQIRDKDLFKYLCCILVVVVGYMSAWTAVTLDHVGSRGSILQTGVTADNLVYVVCQSKWWNYVIETGSSPVHCVHSLRTVISHGFYNYFTAAPKISALLILAPTALDLSLSFAR